MIFLDKITKKSNLEISDSLSVYDNKWVAQQNYKAFETFFYFLKEVKPKRILEIGTATGGFISFIKHACETLSLDCKIITYDIIECPWYKDLRNDGLDLRVENIFDNGYTQVNPDVIDFIQQEGTTIVLCDGGSKKHEFNILSKFIKENDFILGHDYAYDQKFFNENVNFKIWNWFELCEKDIHLACKKNKLVDYRREMFQEIVWVCKMKSSEFYDHFENIRKNKNKKSLNVIHVGIYNHDNKFYEIIKKIENLENCNLLFIEPLESNNNKIEEEFSNYDFILENYIVNINENADHEILFISEDEKYSSLRKTFVKKNYNNVKFELKIPSITLNSLMTKHELNNIHVLFLNCNGINDEIILSIDFERLKIDKIYFISDNEYDFPIVENYLNVNDFIIESEINSGFCYKVVKKKQSNIIPKVTKKRKKTLSI